MGCDAVSLCVTKYITFVRCMHRRPEIYIIRFILFFKVPAGCTYVRTCWCSPCYPRYQPLKTLEHRSSVFKFTYIYLVLLPTLSANASGEHSQANVKLPNTLPSANLVHHQQVGVNHQQVGVNHQTNQGLCYVLDLCRLSCFQNLQS